ncbi:MAG TPA: hypothetical protein VG871_01535 [Vicinamibacterales bacterium]|nr:hypothetical protein [Vicinamibacterales bacterium]
MPSITSFNMAHLHLLLNHVPTVGATVAVGLLILSFFRRDEKLKLVSLELFFAIAVLTLPAFMSGVAAREQIRHDAGISDTAMRIHQDAALGAFAVQEFAGFLAWVALWQARRRRRSSPGLVPVTFGLAVVALALMARAATLGGDIHHPEIVAAGTSVAAIDPAQFVAAKISDVMVNSPWAWPASETIHFLGLSLAFGVLLAVNLRILGVNKQVAFTDVHRLLPWGMLGFGTVFITGMLFFVGQPGQYVGSPPFYWKVVFLMLAGANYLYLTVFERAWTVTSSGGTTTWEFSVGDKAMAIGSMFAWLAILYCGRMLPFIGHSF